MLLLLTIYIDPNGIIFTLTYECESWKSTDRHLNASKANVSEK